MWLPRPIQAGALLAGALASSVAAPIAGLYDQIPAVASYTQAPGGGTFHVTHATQIVVDAASAHSGAPSLLAFATTFRADLIAVLDLSSLPPVAVRAANATTASANSILLTLDAMDHTLFSGAPTDEGYALTIAPRGAVVAGAGTRGAWWGTRTLLQQLVAAGAGAGAGAGLRAGTVRDAPGWPVRGFMLDAGRHWYEPGFIADLCAYASFFKLNELHLHTSDNLWDPNFLYGPGDAWRELYAGFRLRPHAGSPLAGVVPRANESWGRDEFEGMQAACAARGVTVVPEIDTPGHSLAIALWKPELRIVGEPDDLNLSHPDTIPTIRALWDEFLPWIASPVVSIGADEYDSAYADEYLDFVNGMSSYMKSTGNKSIRVWGTAEPSTTRSLSTNITVQHWDFPDGSIPVQLMKKGYDVINSEQAFLYLDMKTSDGGQFPQTLDEPLLWSSGWAPNIFSAADPSNNTSPHDPRLQGAIMALWNDWGNNASTPLEAYYALARSLPLLAEKTWNGAGVRTGGLDAARFNATYPALNAAAPGQNLNRAVTPPRGADGVVFAHDLSRAPAGTVVHTGVASVGPPYTLSFEVQDDPRTPGTATLFSGADSALCAGRLAFVDVPTDVAYPLAPRFALPTDRLARVVVRATRGWTSAEVDGKEAVFWATSMDIWGEYMAAGNMSFAAPAGTIGQAGSGVRFGRVELRLGV